MTCKSCQSNAMVSFPADIRIYLRESRSVSAPPVNPAPNVLVCLSCGQSEFTIDPKWLSAGWLRRSDTPKPFALLRESAHPVTA